MAETVSIDRLSKAAVYRRRFAKPATVSASALAQHPDCSRTYIGKLEAEGVIQRQGDGFPLDQSRVAYLQYLWREHRRSPRTEAEAAHVAVKTEMLQCGWRRRSTNSCAGPMSMPRSTALPVSP